MACKESSYTMPGTFARRDGKEAPKRRKVAGKRMKGWVKPTLQVRLEMPIV